MENGDANIILERAEKAIRMMANCGLSHSAKDVKQLLQYTRALDKNQKSLISALIKLQRENKLYNKTMKKMYLLMSDGQKNIVDAWFENKRHKYDSK